MFQELKKTAPILTRIIEAAAETSAHVKPDHAIICMVAAILLKSRCKHMCKVQMIISSLFMLVMLPKSYEYKKVSIIIILHIVF